MRKATPKAGHYYMIYVEQFITFNIWTKGDKFIIESVDDELLLEVTYITTRHEKVPTSLILVGETKLQDIARPLYKNETVELDLKLNLKR